MDRCKGERGQSCPQCGGSGVLRTNATTYRTCLICVGQGVLPRFEPSDVLPAVNGWRQGQRRGQKAGFRGDLSAWISGAR